MATKRVVIIGAGFAGLSAARELANQAVDVILIDRNNYHIFTPLLYQVATCGLDPSAVAYPIRSIFRDIPNIHFLMGEVKSIDTVRRLITIHANSGEIREESFDYLFIATGSKVNTFNSAEIEANTFGLRDLDDALNIRNHVLKLLEKAAWTTDDAERQALMTFVVVGGGATGLETAGALYELYNNVLDKDYDKHNRLSAKVILLEAAPSLLLPYPTDLQVAAKKQLESLGVVVMTDASVTDVAKDHIALKDGTIIPTHTIIWATGIIGSPVSQLLGITLAKGNRIPVEQTMQVTGLSDIYAAGDITYLVNPENNQPYAGVIQVAQQQGKLVAQNILNQIQGNPLETFRYKDLGIMATIGRRRAVAWIYNRIALSGIVAWMAWLFLHLVTLMGMRNRAQVFINWVWDYIFYDRSVRIIVDQSKRVEKHPELFRTE